MERCCQSQLLAEAAGSPQLIREDWATYTRSHVGRPQDGWLGFQSFWEDILRSDPDLLE
jgi:DNA-binding transcriptional LysR family regulator